MSVAHSSNSYASNCITCNCRVTYRPSSQAFSRLGSSGMCPRYGTPNCCAIACAPPALAAKTSAPAVMLNSSGHFAASTASVCSVQSLPSAKLSSLRTSASDTSCGVVTTTAPST
eukprot:10609-Heterococcus_DN1.PRE.3